MSDDVCQCPHCGRMHRRLGNPPASVMEQIARDMREGTFPQKSEATLREESRARYFVSKYTDGPATRWNVIDRRTQEWIRRFPTEQEALLHAASLNA